MVLIFLNILKIQKRSEKDLKVGCATKLDYPDNFFDLVISIKLFII